MQTNLPGFPGFLLFLQIFLQNFPVAIEEGRISVRENQIVGRISRKYIDHPITSVREDRK